MSSLNIFLVCLVTIFGIYIIYENVNENYENPRVQTTGQINNLQNNNATAQVVSNADLMGPTDPIPYNENVLPYPQQSNLYEQQTEFTPPNTGCTQPDVLKPADLLPKPDPHSTWNLSNPPVNGSLSDKNFLDSAYFFGIDTISGSNRNGNQGLRSDPYIQPADPKTIPWGMGTISADTNRRHFEIGSN